MIISRLPAPTKVFLQLKHNTGQRSIMARKGTSFWKMGYKNLTPPSLYNFHKRGQHSTVERNIGLEYAMLVASNSHISTLSCPLWKKSYILAVPVIMSFKVLKYWSILFVTKEVLFYLSACGNEISNRKKCFCFFSEILTHTRVGFFQDENDHLWLKFPLIEIKWNIQMIIVQMHP